MSEKKLIFFVLSAFIVATVFLIYIQSNSAKNINSLIAGNEQYAAEFKVNLELKALERNVVNIQSKLRSAVTTGEQRPDSILVTRYKAIDKQLQLLQTVADDSVTVIQVDLLDSLVRRKLTLYQVVMQTLRTNGTEAAQKQVNANLATWLMDSLYVVTENIEKSRHVILARLTESNAKSGQKALRFNSILIGLVLVCGAGLFWYIINIVRKQVSLIRRLHESEKKVSEGASLKEKFMANMSHEIRTPMNAILGFTNLLQRRPLDEESKEYVDTIQKSGEILLTIINDILDLSKIEAGMMRIEVAPFSMQGLAHSIETMFAPKAKEKQIDFSVMVDETFPETVEGDPTRLTQIMVNLIGNAIKFTEKGNVLVRIQNEGINRDTIQTGIIVKDSGIGVDKEHLAKIFGRFQQAEDAVTRKYGGTGLGLAIVSDLVNLQHGTISAESEPRKGTVFHLQLPYKISGEQRSAAIEKPILHNEPDLENNQILVIEDNEVNQSLLKHLFNYWNLNYDMADNGRQAIARLQEKKYDLILMDIQMPEMDGYTAAKEIRTGLKIDTPIIAMTAHALAGEREKCLGCGMNEYISKPIREDQLWELINRFTQPKRVEKPNTRDTKEALPNDTFRIIDLAYMKTISNGNIGYEKTVTGQFITAIPKELEDLQSAWKVRQLPTVNAIAHNLRTTVSVMGLNEQLEPYLDALEGKMLTEPDFFQNYPPLKHICEAALQEAAVFYATL